MDNVDNAQLWFGGKLSMGEVTFFNFASGMKQSSKVTSFYEAKAE